MIPQEVVEERDQLPLNLDVPTALAELIVPRISHNTTTPVPGHTRLNRERLVPGSVSRLGSTSCCLTVRIKFSMAGLKVGNSASAPSLK